MTIMTYAIIILLVVTAAEDDPAGDLDSLQGTWQHIEHYRTNGEQLSPERVEQADATTTFQGNRMTNRIHNGSEYQQQTFRIEIDPSRSPKTIDWWVIEGVPPVLGIYEVEGDTLRISWGSGSLPRTRPTELAPCHPDELVRWTYNVFRRVRPE